MKLWVDDIRTPPDSSWMWVETSRAAISLLKRSRLYQEQPLVMSLDHDLGGDDTTRAVVLWCCENDYWPKVVTVHSANPVGIEWLEGMIERYKS